MFMQHISLSIIPYISLLCSVWACLWRKPLLVGFFASISVSLALVCKVVRLQGVLYIAAFLTIALLKQKKINTFNQCTHRRLKMLFCGAEVIMALALANHIASGFHNILLLKQWTISQHSVPYSMYLNFDKTIAAIILFFGGCGYNDGAFLRKRSLITAAVALVLCIGALITPSFLLGHVAYDFKIPSIWPIWCINNFFFVCFAEEMIYRCLMQGALRRFLSVRLKKIYVHILISSMLFGIIQHFRGGPMLIALSLIAGIFYGVVYDKTRSILWSMIVHFTLNLIHFIMFTYPFARSFVA